MDEKIVCFQTFLEKRFERLIDIKHSYKECSKYGSGEHLVNSEKRTINFDKLTEWYAPPGEKPCSADSMSFSDDCLYLIEFKSGDLTKSERKLEGLISNVADKINDSDSTLTSLYEETFEDKKNRLEQKFCLVVDSKQLGIVPLTAVLVSLSTARNVKEKVLLEKVRPNLKEAIANPDHYSDVEIWYSEIFDQYINTKNIRSSV